jgi:ribosomal protein S18 acetylase RimI-like enzyme
MKEKINIKLHNTISKKELLKIISILKKENKNSLLVKLSNKLIESYFLKCVFSKNFYLYTFQKNKELIGYSLFVSKPSYLFTDLKDLRFKIILDLTLKLNFLTISNLIISYLSLDSFFIKKKNKHLIEKNLNLNLLAIAHKYQSQGYGTFILKSILRSFKNKKFKYVTLETDNIRSFNFYIKKLSFQNIGTKLRFFLTQDVLLKKI